VADIPSGGDAEVSADGTGLRVQGVGGTKHEATSLDNFSSLPNHTDNGARKHVLDEGGEERLLREILVVLLEESLRGSGKLKSNEVVSSCLKPLDDLANESTLHSVGLDHNVGALVGHLCLVLIYYFGDGFVDIYMARQHP